MRPGDACDPDKQFVVETDRAGEPPMPFWSETVRRVVVG